MIITYPIAFLFEIIFPFVLAIWFMRRYRTSWRLFWIGALVFIGSQVLHLPFLVGLNALFVNGTLPLPPRAYLPFFNAVVGGLAAGIFEETARVVAFWRLKDQARSWKAAVTLGIGHEASESILIAGLPLLINYVVMMLVVYAPQVIPSSSISTLQAQAPLFFATTWDLPLASALERLSTFPIQIA
ncbi:MAG: YhfC family glutamic-type intramembrane protease, partial [Anaerolineaceae bacterium]|nr:YhfC family glutamic-type intramembrane protease [Anaerolineaceae bacterium]